MLRSVERSLSTPLGLVHTTVALLLLVALTLQAARARRPAWLFPLSAAFLLVPDLSDGVGSLPVAGLAATWTVLWRLPWSRNRLTLLALGYAVAVLATIHPLFWDGPWAYYESHAWLGEVLPWPVRAPHRWVLLSFDRTAALLVWGTAWLTCFGVLPVLAQLGLVAWALRTRADALRDAS